MSIDAICGSTGLSREELIEYRYQSSGTGRAVYAIGDDYYCAGNKHPENLLGLTWRKHNDQFFAERKNTIVWIANSQEEEL